MKSEETAPARSLDKTEVDHFIITRFGIGQEKEDFYEANFPLLRFVLAKSLEEQTNPKFTWIVIVDSKCPSWVLEGIEEFCRGTLNLIVVVHDPWSYFSMMPSLFEVLRPHVSPGKRIVTTRIDHDDAAAVSFNEVLLEHLEPLSSSFGSTDIAISYPRGIAYFVRAKLALAVLKPDYSVVSMVSRYGPDFIDCYQERHTQFFKNRPGRGAMSVDVGRPLWMRTVRPDSTHKFGAAPSLSELGDAFPLVRIPQSILMRAFRPGYNTLYLSLFARGLICEAFGVTSKDIEGLRAREHTKLSSRQYESFEKFGLAETNQFAAKEKILDGWKNRLSNSDFSDESLEDVKAFFYSF